MRKPVVPHHNYHPRSWSVQARELADRIAFNVNHGYLSIQEASHWFSNSYRHPMIKNRAAKRFGRLVRTGKVKEPKND